jgi:hypothetical protein
MVHIYEDLGVAGFSFNIDLVSSWLAGQLCFSET